MKQTMAMTDTRNQAWVNDKSKFGYKMLEKMGWSEGKGLGAKEDGMTSHVRVRRTSTNAGIGSGKALNDWNKPAQVAEGLNAVLSRLAPVECEKVVVKAPKVSVKGRGYYQRRSAGKNVGAYSENDLREIFGGINVSRKAEDGENEKGSQEREDLQNKNRGSGEKADENENGQRMSAKSKGDRDSRQKRKRSREEKGKKAKRESLGVKPTIKKRKKSKKGRSRETR